MMRVLANECFVILLSLGVIDRSQGILRWIVDKVTRSSTFPV